MAGQAMKQVHISRLSGERLAIAVTPSTTVAEVRANLAPQCMRPAGLLRLVLGGSPLEDHELLWHRLGLEKEKEEGEEEQEEEEIFLIVGDYLRQIASLRHEGSVVVQDSTGAATGELWVSKDGNLMSAAHSRKPFTEHNVPEREALRGSLVTIACYTKHHGTVLAQPVDRRGGDGAGGEAEAAGEAPTAELLCPSLLLLKDGATPLPLPLRNVGRESGSVVTSPVTCLCTFPDSVVSGHLDGSLWLWVSGVGRRLRTSHETTVVAVLSLMGFGEFLLSASKHRITCEKMHDGDILFHTILDDFEVRDLANLKDNRVLGVACSNSVRLMNGRGEEKWRLLDGCDATTLLALGPDPEHCVVGNRNGDIRVVCMTGWTHLAFLRNHLDAGEACFRKELERDIDGEIAFTAHPIRALDYSAGASLLASGGEGGVCLVQNLPQNLVFDSPQAATVAWICDVGGPISALAFSGEKRTALVVATSSGVVLCREGEILQQVTDHVSTCLAPWDEASVCVGTAEGEVVVYEVLCPQPP